MAPGPCSTPAQLPPQQVWAGISGQRREDLPAQDYWPGVSIGDPTACSPLPQRHAVPGNTSPSLCFSFKRSQNTSAPVGGAFDGIRMTAEWPGPPRPRPSQSGLRGSQPTAEPSCPHSPSCRTTALRCLCPPPGEPDAGSDGSCAGPCPVCSDRSCSLGTWAWERPRGQTDSWHRRPSSDGPEHYGLCPQGPAETRQGDAAGEGVSGDKNNSPSSPQGQHRPSTGHKTAQCGSAQEAEQGLGGGMW